MHEPAKWPFIDQQCYQSITRPNLVHVRLQRHMYTGHEKYNIHFTTLHPIHTIA